MDKKDKDYLKGTIKEGGLFNPVQLTFEIHYLYVLKDVHRNGHLLKVLAGLALAQAGNLLATFRVNKEISIHERFQREALDIRGRDWAQGYVSAHRNDFFDIKMIKDCDLMADDEYCHLTPMKKKYQQLLANTTQTPQ